MFSELALKGNQTSLHEDVQWLFEQAHQSQFAQVPYGSQCRLRTAPAPQNFALLRQIALNLLTQEQTAKVGVQAKRKKAGWDDAYLCKVLAQ